MGQRRQNESRNIEFSWCRRVGTDIPEPYSSIAASFPNMRFFGTGGAVASRANYRFRKLSNNLGVLRLRCANYRFRSKITIFEAQRPSGRPTAVRSAPQGRQGHLWDIQTGCRAAPRRVASKNIRYRPKFTARGWEGVPKRATVQV